MEPNHRTTLLPRNNLHKIKQARNQYYSNNCSTDIQESKQHVKTNLTGNTTIPLLRITTPLIEEGLVGVEQANESNLPLTSTEVPQLKQEMLYVPLVFEKKPKCRCLGRLKSLRYCNCPEWFRHKKTESPKFYSQNRRPSCFPNTGSQRPVRTIVNNSHI